MDRNARNPYELLGVAPTANERDIRHAYRVRVVTMHRSRVLGLVDELDALKAAYEALKDPIRRRAINVRMGVPSSERGVRLPAAQEVLRHSLRIGAEAKRGNAETLREIARDYDQRERDVRRRLLRRERIARYAQVLAVVALLALAVVAARRLGIP